MNVQKLRSLCEQLVISLAGEENAPKWWNSYNLSFKMSPNQQWEKDPLVVKDYLISYALAPI